MAKRPTAPSLNECKYLSDAGAPLQKPTQTSKDAADLANALAVLSEEASRCVACQAQLPLSPRPIFRVDARARVLVIGQAPGRTAHETALTWNDRSGDRLRSWMGVDRTTFYDTGLFAMIPMGMCYPGRGKSGDMPPRPECAPLWHSRFFGLMPERRLTVYVGSYSFAYYLGNEFTSLTSAVFGYASLLPGRMQLPHPSPRNGYWVKQHPGFEEKVIPALQAAIHHALNTNDVAC